MKIYDYFPLDINYADKHYIFSKNGLRYIDTFAGIGVLSLGHSDQGIMDAMKDKMSRYMHLSNFFKDQDYEDVEKLLIQMTGHQHGGVFFGNSGTEAVEASLKALRKIKKDFFQNKKKYIITFSGSFHGRTTGASALSHDRFAVDPDENVISLKFNDKKNLKDFFNQYGDQVLALYVEAIQGSGGVVPLERYFANQIMEYKNKFKFVLVCDEIQCGLGRTGANFAYQQYNLDPDIVTVAKSLGGGLPLGACLFLKQYSNIFSAGEYGTTFGPNPVALSGAKVLLNRIHSYLNLNVEKGKYFKKKLLEIRKNIRDVRGEGLMLALELEKPIEDLRMKAFEKSLLLNVVQGKIIRFLPAFTIDFEDIDFIVDTIKDLVEN